MSRRYPRPWREKLRSLYSWHRWLGITSALFVIWLALTGLALQHSDDLGLDGRHTAYPVLLSGLGIDIEPPGQALRHTGRWLSHVDGRLYLDLQPIERAPRPIGFTQLGDLWVIASRESLWLLNTQGEILEKHRGLDLPGRIEQLGRHQDALILGTDRGRFAANPQARQWPDWQPSHAPLNVEYQWADLPEPMSEELLRHAQAQTLSWSRILLDAHSGRLFGAYGVLIMDIMAVIFVVLGISGLWLWLRFRKAIQARRRHQKNAER